MRILEVWAPMRLLEVQEGPKETIGITVWPLTSILEVWAPVRLLKVQEGP